MSAKPTPVLDVALTPREPAGPLAERSEVLTLIEKVVFDPNADIAKLEKMIELHERLLRQSAEQQFNIAMAETQKAIRRIRADKDNKQTNSRYASYAALDRVIRPIYTEHGLALSFNTEPTERTDFVRVTCTVTHVDGHARPYGLELPADGQGAKGGQVMTRTHATGSALQYGMRYLLRMIFNVAIGDDDDDGNAAGRTVDVEAPKGFEKWWDDLQSVADNGQDALRKAWEQSKLQFRKHLTDTNSSGWEELKRKAAEVSAKAKEQA